CRLVVVHVEQSHHISWLLVLTTGGGVISAFEIPARQAMIVELVSHEDLVDAIALNSGGFNLARIVGPSIAAIILARYGLAWCFGINAFSYLAERVDEIGRAHV